MELDRNGLEVLERDECLALLGSMPVARLGFSQNALPVILPVNFVLDRDCVVFRTTGGTKLDAALHGSVVAVEADSYDAMGHVGWSVLVRGIARVVEDEGELERARRLPLRRWANDEDDRFVCVSADVVTGRRIRAWYQPDGHEPTTRIARAAGA